MAKYDMKSNPYDEMAFAVENAILVIMCFSQRYFCSDYCKDEALYSKRTKKLIIPVRMQPNFKPDGWLGMITAAPLGFDLSSHPNIEKNLKDLLSAVKEQTKEQEWYLNFDLH